jgi:ribosomal protein L16 Arg81 hydroxylase
LGKKTDGNRPLGTPRDRNEDNIKTGFVATDWQSLGWFILAQDEDHWQDPVNRATFIFHKMLGMWQAKSINAPQDGLP